jgi:two-component system, response regulator PdtaR
MVSKLPPLRLILADGDTLFRQELRRSLEEAGYRVLAEASDGCEALALAHALRPDLVVLDIPLPGLDGIGVAAALHQERITPAVMLTAQSSPELVRRAARAGILSYVSKPVSVPALIAALEVAHNQWVTERQHEQKLRRLQEKEATRAVVDEAKRVLIQSCGMSEIRAYRSLQIRSMDTRRPLREVAQAVLNTYALRLPLEVAASPTTDSAIASTAI